MESATRGVKNVLRDLKMLEGPLEGPGFQIIIEKSTWIRAERGGFLQFHVKPGDLISRDKTPATNTTRLGCEQSMMHASFDRVVIGMTTLPPVRPGEPVCTLGQLPAGTPLPEILRQRSEGHGLGGRISEELASSVLVVDPS